MLYSVWSPSAKRYTYFETKEGHRDDPPKPRGGGSRMGAAPGQLGYGLPPGARRIGEGPLARGVVVHPSPGGGLGLGFFESEAGGIMLIAAAYLTWKYLLPKTRWK